MDRHVSLDVYRQAKANLFRRSQPSDACIVHEPERESMQRLSGGAGRWVTFGSWETADYAHVSGRITKAGRSLVDLGGTYFGNDVLGENAAGAIATIDACGVDPAIAERVARS